MIDRQFKLMTIVLATAMLSFFGCQLKKQDDPRSPRKNAVWVESIYFRGYNPSTHELLTENTIKKFCQRMSDNKIKYAYLFAGPFDSAGHLPRYPFSELAANTVKLINRYDSDLVVLPWLGGIQNETVFLDDTTWVHNAISEIKLLVKTLHVPGVHLDFEFILKDQYVSQKLTREEKSGDNERYGTDVNQFHKLLRNQAPNMFVSSVVAATSKNTKPWKRKTTINELRELLKYIDQISFLFFDTNIHNAQIFQTSSDQLIQDIGTLKDEYPRIQYFVSIGTFLNDPSLRHFRDMDLENIPNTLRVLQNSISHKPVQNRALLNGISVYCDWQTDPQEWMDFNTYWSPQ